MANEFQKNSVAKILFVVERFDMVLMSLFKCVCCRVNVVYCVVCLWCRYSCLNHIYYVLSEALTFLVLQL